MKILWQSEKKKKPRLLLFRHQADLTLGGGKRERKSVFSFPF
jgi:hypothetical protein